MTIEQQVVSLEYAERLKVLGVSQQSIFRWMKTSGKYQADKKPVFFVSDENFQELQDMYMNEATRYGLPSDWQIVCAAYSVAELGMLLPEKVCWRGYTNYGGKWRMEFGDFRVEADTEADTRAKMLIYLLENNLIVL